MQWRCKNRQKYILQVILLNPPLKATVSVPGILQQASGSKIRYATLNSRRKQQYQQNGVIYKLSKFACIQELRICCD